MYEQLPKGVWVFRRLILAGGAGVVGFAAFYGLAALAMPVLLTWIGDLGPFPLGQDLANQIRSVGAVGVGLTAGGTAARFTWRASRRRSATPDRLVPVEIGGRIWNVEPAGADTVGRSTLAEGLKGQLLEPPTTAEIPKVVGVLGTAGYGKTTLVQQVCSEQDVWNHFTGGCLWVTLGPVTALELAERVKDVCAQLTGIRPSAQDARKAGLVLGDLLDKRNDTLLVIDDARQLSDLAPFLQGGGRCVRLLTTRHRGCIPGSAGSKALRIDRLSTVQSLDLLLSGGLARPADSATSELLELTDGWPLLLRTVNRLLSSDLRRGAQATAAARRIATKLRQGELDLLTLGSAPHAREQSPWAALSASVALLSPTERDFFLQLGTLPSADIPHDVVLALWSDSTGDAPQDVGDICEKLDDLSLVQEYRPGARGLKLHRAVQEMLARHNETDPAHTDRVLISTARTLVPQGREPHAADGTQWWRLAGDSVYWWRYLCRHLKGAGHLAELLGLVTDLRWIENKLALVGAEPVVQDLDLVDDPTANALRRQIVCEQHILRTTQPLRSVSDTLVSRLSAIAELRHLALAHSATLPPAPRLISRWTVPDQPHPLLARVLGPHTAEVVTCAISDDASFAVAVCGWPISRAPIRQDKVYFWEIETGRLRHSFDDGPLMSSCAVSQDTSLVLTAGSKNRVRDAITGVVVSELPGAAMSCAIAPDRSFVVTTSGGNPAQEDHTARVWNPTNGAQLHVLTGHTDGVLSCAIAPDRSFIVTTSSDHTARVWNPTNGAQLHVLTGHTDGVLSCAIAPDRSFIVTTSSDHTARVWNPTNGAQLHVLTGHTDGVLSCAIAPDRSFIVTTSSDHTARVWNPTNGAQLHVLTGHTDGVLSCAIAPDRSFIVTTSSDHTARVWNPTNGAQLHVLTGHSRPVLTCVLAKDGSLLLTAGRDRTVRVWNAADFTKVSCATWEPSPHAVAAESCDISPSMVLAACNDHMAHGWDLATGAERLVLTGHTDVLTDVAMSSDESFIVTTSRDSTARVWAAPMGLEGATLTGHSAPVRTCAIAPDNSFIVTTSDDITARVWEPVDGTQMAVLSGHTRAISSATIAPDGAQIATTGHDASYDRAVLRLWSPSGDELEAFGVQVSPWDRLSTAAFAPSGIYLVMGGSGWSDYGRTIIWWPGSGVSQELRSGYATYGIESVAVSSDDSFIAVAARGGSLHVHEASDGSARFTVHHFGTDAIVCDISPDDSAVLTVSADGLVAVFDAVTGRALAAVRVGGYLRAGAWLPDGSGVCVAGGSGVYVFDYRPTGATPAEHVLRKGDPLHMKALGALLHDLRRYEEAHDVYTAVCDQDPADAQAQSDLGHAWSHVGDLEAAIHHLSIATSLAPDDFSARWRLASAYTSLGDAAGAEHELRVCAQIRPDDLDVLAQLARMLASSNPAEAHAVAEQVFGGKARPDGWDHSAHRQRPSDGGGRPPRRSD